MILFLKKKISFFDIIQTFIDFEGGNQYNILMYVPLEFRRYGILYQLRDIVISEGEKEDEENISA